MNKNMLRVKVLDFLQWNDGHGCYTDEYCELEDVQKFTYEDAVKYFFGIINEDFYCTQVDNIFELTYEEVIEYAKLNNFYESTMKKFNLLRDEPNPTEVFYKSII